MSTVPAPAMEDVSAVIGSLYQNDQIVKLTRQYKGITLAQEARLVEVTPDSAKLQTTRTQHFPWLDGEIHLHNPALPRPIAARMRSLNLEQGVFLLSDFAYKDWKNRQSERVQPQKPTYVKFFCRRESYRALLEDISLDGIGILADKNIDPEDRIRAGSKLNLYFQFSEGEPFSDLKGMLVYRQKIGLHLVKFGIHLYPNQTQKSILERIINRRKEEILQELEQAYSLARGPQRIENLYF
jgi:hypothetical protein